MNRPSRLARAVRSAGRPPHGAGRHDPQPCPSDMTDEQWAIVEPLTPASKLGRPREVEIRRATTLPSRATTDPKRHSSGMATTEPTAWRTAAASN